MLVSTYRLRATVREIGKARNLPPGEIEQVAKLADRAIRRVADDWPRLPGFSGRGARRFGKELGELVRRSRGCRGTFQTWAG